METYSLGGTKAPVTQLDTVPDLNLLVALADGALSLWDTDSLKRRPSGGLDSKGAAMFAVNLAGGPKFRLCVVTTKRRLRLYEWSSGNAASAGSGLTLAAATASASGFSDSNGKYVFWKEFDLPDTPRAITYYGSMLACGYQREYNVLCADTGAVTDVTGVMSRDTRPLIKHLPGDHLLIVTADGVGVVLNRHGEPAGQAAPGGGVPGLSVPALQFGHHPQAIGYCYPYAISVADASNSSGSGGRGVLEVHAGRDRRDEVVQRLDSPGGSACVPVALADGRVGSSFRSTIDYADAAKGRNPVYVAFTGPNRICRLLPVPVDRQVGDLLRQFQVAPAQELLVNTAPAHLLRGKLERLNIDAGRSLTLGLHFEASFPHLTASPIDPREVIALFPDLQVSHAAVAAAMRPQNSGNSNNSNSIEPGDGAANAVSLARCYRYPSRFLTSTLTQAVATGLKRPSEAASESADAATGGPYCGLSDTELPTAIESLRLAVGQPLEGGSSSSSSGSSGAGVNPLRTGIADVGSLIHAGLGGYLQRMREEEALARGGTAVASEVAATTRTGGGLRLPPRKQAQAVADRMTAAYEGVTRFLRHRRAVLHEVARVRRRQAARRPPLPRQLMQQQQNGHLAFLTSYNSDVNSDSDADDDDEDGKGGAGGRKASYELPMDGDDVSDYGDEEDEEDGDAYDVNRALASSSGTAVARAAASRIMVVRKRGKRRVYVSLGSSYTPALLLRGGTIAGGISVPPISDAELGSLLLAVDTALLRCLSSTERWRQLDVLLADPHTSLSFRDVDPLLRDKGRFHTLGLMYRCRGMGASALTLWRDLGSGGLSERRLGSEEEELWGGKGRGRRGARRAPALFAASIVGASAASATAAGGRDDDSVGGDGANGDDDVSGSSDDSDGSDGEGGSGSKKRASAGAADYLSDYEECGADGLLVLTRAAATRQIRRQQRAAAAAALSSSSTGPAGAAARRRRRKLRAAAAPAVLGLSVHTPLPARRERARAALDAATAGTGLTGGISNPFSSSTGSSAANLVMIDDRYDGLGETIAYLRCETDDSDLLFTFAEWALLRSPARALPIFTRPARPTPLHPDTIIAYLSGPKFADAARRHPGGGVLVTSAPAAAAAGGGSASTAGPGSPLRLFLEHQVFSRGLGSEGPSEASYHTRLAREYASAIAALRSDPAVVASAMAGGGSSSSSSSKANIQQQLDPVEADRLLGGPARDRPAPGTEGGALGALRARLVGLLQESPHLDASALLAWPVLGSSSLWEERLLLHGRLGQHASALALLVFDLADHDAAVRYCSLAAHAAKGGHTPSSSSSAAATVGGGGADAGSDIIDTDPFLLLLRLYLEADAAEKRRQQATAAAVSARIGGSSSVSTVPSRTVYLSRALDVLSSQAHLIEPLALCRLLPPDLPLSALLPYWSSVLPASAHAVRSAAVAKGLWNHTYIASHARLIDAQAVPTILHRGSTCAVCDGRLLGDTVFALLPGSPPAPVHFHCLRTSGGGNGNNNTSGRGVGDALGLDASSSPDGLTMMTMKGTAGGDSSNDSYGARLLGLPQAAAAAAANGASKAGGTSALAASLLTSAAASGTLDPAAALATCHGVLQLYAVRHLTGGGPSAATAAGASIALSGAPATLPGCLLPEANWFSFAVSAGWVRPDGSVAVVSGDDSGAVSASYSSSKPASAATSSSSSSSVSSSSVSSSSPFAPLPLLDVSSFIRTNTVVPTVAGSGKGGSSSSSSSSAAAASAGNPFSGGDGDADDGPGFDASDRSRPPPRVANPVANSGGIKISKDEIREALKADAAAAAAGKAGPTIVSSSSGSRRLLPVAPESDELAGADGGAGASGQEAEAAALDSNGDPLPVRGKLDLTSVVLDEGYFAYVEEEGDGQDGAAGGEYSYTDSAADKAASKGASPKKPGKSKGAAAVGAGGGVDNVISGPAARYLQPKPGAAP